MSNQRPSIRLRLTRDQQEEVRKATGRSVKVIELGVEELESRIAPAKLSAPGPIPIPYPSTG
jgi:hypothetical protein